MRQAGAGEVEAINQLREVRGLPADDRDVRLGGSRVQAFPDFFRDFRVRVLHRQVVDERERLSADAQRVVDVHRDAINPDRVVFLQRLGDANLGADPVGAED